MNPVAPGHKDTHDVVSPMLGTCDRIRSVAHCMSIDLRTTYTESPYNRFIRPAIQKTDIHTSETPLCNWPPD